MMQCLLIIGAVLFGLFIACGNSTVGPRTNYPAHLWDKYARRRFF